MGDMDAELVTGVDNGENTQDVGSNSFNLVLLAPIDIGCAAGTGAVDDTSGLVLGELAG